MPSTDNGWDRRIERVVKAVAAIQSRRHTASLNEVATACGVTRQTISTWLKQAEKVGLIDRHRGEPRSVELLPLAWHTILAKRKRKQYSNLSKVTW